ncbi:MAG: hypothetical protein FJY77_02255 [Candidatus Altiarchaeales archaeon]|nr:hypothetical protein [Candidatus Altiarchaeales archaeon]
MTRRQLDTTSYEQAQADARKYEERGDVVSAAAIYSRAGEMAFKDGSTLASYMCLNKAAGLIDKALEEPRSDGEMQTLLNDSARLHFYAGMTAVRIRERGDKFKPTPEESELWWEKAVGHFADYKAAMRKLQGKEGVKHQRNLHAEGLERLNDLQVAEMLQLEWLEPAEQTRNRRPPTKTSPGYTILKTRRN